MGCCRLFKLPITFLVEILSLRSIASKQPGTATKLGAVNDFTVVQVGLSGRSLHAEQTTGTTSPAVTLNAVCTESSQFCSHNMGTLVYCTTQRVEHTRPMAFAR